MTFNLLGAAASEGGKLCLFMMIELMTTNCLHDIKRWQSLNEGESEVGMRNSQATL